MSGYDTLQVTVDSNGSVKANGVTYWSEALVKLAGVKVSLRVWPQVGSPAQVWMGHHYICSPEPMRDTGFADVDAAAATAQRLRRHRDNVRAAAKAEGELAAREIGQIGQSDPKLFKERIKASAVGFVSGFLCIGAVWLSVTNDPRCHPWHTFFDGNGHSHDEAAQGSNLGVNGAVRFVSPVGHNRSTPVASDHKPSATGDAGHRLCGDAK